MIYKTLKKVSDVCQLVDKSKYPATQTVNGVTFTKVDGGYQLNGTCTVSINLYIISSGIPISKGHKYLLLDNRTQRISNDYFPTVQILNDNATFSFATIDSMHEGVCFTNVVTKDDICHMRIRIGEGVVYNNVVLLPQLFDLTEMYGAGNEPTTVEQFRQDFPEEMYDYKPYCFVKSYKTLLKVSDNKIITSYKKSLVCNTKNLFDINSVSNLNNWVTKTSADRPYAYYQFNLKPNTTYTFSRKYASNNDKVYACFSKNYGVGVEDGMFIHPTASTLVKDKVTFTTDNAGIMYLNVYTIRSLMNSFIELIEGAQLELGDTATDYVPYGHL